MILQKFLVSLLVLVMLCDSSEHSVCYVKSEYPSSSCPGLPCLTLDQYASQATKYFTTGATFLFLVGNHTLYTPISLQNISHCTLKAISDSNCTVLSKAMGIIKLSEVFNFTIQGLTFVLPSTKYKFTAVFGLLKSKNVFFINMTFLGNLSGLQVAAIYCNHSDVMISGSLFMENTGYNGGAVYAFETSITFIRNVFSGNKALHGGSIAVAKSNVTLDGNVFVNNEADSGGAIIAISSSVTLKENIGNTFACNFGIMLGGAVYCSKYSRFVIEKANCNQTASKGYEAREVDINCIKFSKESGKHNTSVYPLSTYFIGNKAGVFGGAIKLSRNSVASLNGTLVVFHQNLVKQIGGAIHAQYSALLISGTDVIFHENSAQDDNGVGGGIYCAYSTLTADANNVIFSRNNASSGGGIYIGFGQCSLLSVHFLNNTASLGAGMGMIETNVSLRSINANNNMGGAFFILTSMVEFSGRVEISYNIGDFGGGILVTLSSINFTGDTIFKGNYAHNHGGAVYVQDQSTLTFSGFILFIDSKTNGNGGAIFATGDATIIPSNHVSFKLNQAKQNGGAMYVESGTKILLRQNTILNFSGNSATGFGGAIFHSDAITPSQCGTSMHHNEANLEHLPNCFIINEKRKKFAHNIFLHNNTAGKDGSFMFGGLLDKCEAITVREKGTQKNKTVSVRYVVMYPIFFHEILNITPSNNTQIQLITSEPYLLCFCDSTWDYYCNKEMTIKIYKGRKFSVSLLALAQGDAVTSSPVRAILTPNARLLPNQISQFLPRNCTGLTFNMYSTEEQEELVLYLDDCPCRDNGLARAAINITFLPCPDGFTLSGDQCVCERRLQAYNANCMIFDDSIYITRHAEDKFWVSALNSPNGAYKGLILYPKCPIEYCRTETVNITLNEPDDQCNRNRSGLLCGTCSTNYSITFGSSACDTCSNTFLALLFPLAAAGIALVFFLTLLRLTVATGTINSVILYSNIVQANKNILFPASISSNILTVFIAWMNLDLGFSTCFYNGMDAYAQTWLQFAFPIYIWILIGLILIASRYSMTVTKLIGSNPIAVLATLLLMSYAKLLKVIIDVYSSVHLEYPENKTVTVWLKDANVPYLKSWHLALTVVTTLFLVFFFLPYTLLLLLGYKLYRLPSRKYTRWLIRIKPLLDSYYAPCKIHTRYWAGFLLLVRCVLYIVSSYNSLGHSTQSLLAINITFSAIIVWPWLTATIYTKSLINTIEAVVYLNLVVLSAAALADVHSSTLVYSLVGIVFSIMIGVIIYHFLIFYLAKSITQLKKVAKVTFTRAAENHSQVSDNPREGTPLLNPAKTRPITKSVVSVREPLLED